MAITLTVGATTLPLHADLLWADEHSWHPVEQTTQRTITGALIISSAARITGRPITLRAEDESSAWMSRATVEQLRAWAAIPGQQMTLMLRGQARTVVFRHHESAGFEATPVVHYSDVDNADFYTAVLRLMEV